MSDVLLGRIADALEGLLKVASAAPKAAAATTAPKPSTPPAGAAAGNKPATPPANKNPATTAGATKPKPGAAPAAATKAPGGKYNSEQVRDIIRKVAANPALGKESARGVLNEDGGGVSTVSEVKPDHFDAVYEACQVLLSGEGAGAGGADPDDPTA